MACVPTVTSESRLEAQHLVHAFEADGRNMSGAQQEPAMTTDSLHLNRSKALGFHNKDVNTALFEFRVFNIVIIMLALCVLTITGLYCITVCYNRSRQSKRAHIYESAVIQGEPVDPVTFKGVKKSTSFINPLTFFRKQDTANDNSRIYYIYCNPLPIGAKEEEESGTKAAHRLEEKTKLSLPLSFQEYANDQNRLDPPIFYMQF